MIEERLERLGLGAGESAVGSYSDVPHIHAPHARAASVRSSPPLYTRTHAN
jgi:hypothetical protein